MTIKHYFDKPLTFQFTANVVEATLNEDDTSNIILDETYFYPAGGGQDHDLGTLNDQQIKSVKKEGDIVIHVIAGEPLAGTVTGKLDADYRRRNMAAHTGQHILSAILLHDLSAETLAVRMNAHGLSTVDVNLADLSPEQIQTVENAVNQAIQANHPVHSLFVPPDSPKLEELRRAVKFDKVTGDVRLVEIESIDLSACAGTHVPFTGMLGMLKLFKVENYKGGSRIHFAAGMEALDQFRKYQHELDTVSNLLSSGIDQVAELVEKLQSERGDLNKQVIAQKEQLLAYEVQTHLATLEASKALLSFENRENDDLRTLANLLVEVSQRPLVITNQQGDMVTLIVATSENDDVHAGNILKAILAEFDGRGGGRDSYAQGVLKNFDDLTALSTVIEQHLP